LDWGDIGPLSVDPTTSKVQGKVGSVILPGSKQVLDRSTGKLVPCTSQNCPYAINGINHGPFAAFGGWSGAINAADDPKVKDAAYDFLSYMSQPAQSSVDVTIGKTGFNPYRTSHFTNLDPWIKSGMTQEGAQNYLGAIKDSLNSPNMILDMRTPRPISTSRRYWTRRYPSSCRARSPNSRPWTRSPRAGRTSPTRRVAISS
jgi:multiple sugar transport system substrate-binding protein